MTFSASDSFEFYLLNHLEFCHLHSKYLDLELALFDLKAYVSYADTLFTNLSTAVQITNTSAEFNCGHQKELSDDQTSRRIRYVTELQIVAADSQVISTR